jgi:CRISPR-associated endonuclease/helicase Cas3/CRISPR-associated endonuclease Cas3-HD
VLSDKTAAAGIPSTAMQPQALELDALEDYLTLSQPGSARERDKRVAEVLDGSIETVDEGSLNAFREAARRRIRETAPALADFEVGTITLPTGLGKTFSGITGAFSLRDELHKRSSTSQKPVVVYALPYTSIIEQTREHFEDERIFNADPAGREFTVHHYLTDTVTYADGEDDPRTGQTNLDISRPDAQLLGESWRAGVVLTTFVQLFESLAGPTNAQGLKLSALQNSVIILDEPQAIPKSWWGATRRLVRLLLDQYDARVISMTATQPTLFTEGDFETISLLDGRDDDDSQSKSLTFEERAYNAVPRVRYRIDESVGTFSPERRTDPVTHSDAAGRLVDDALSTNGESRSVLSVCNTIASSRELTERVVDDLEGRGRTVTHIGDTLETVLERLDRVSGELPDPDRVTTVVLQELGCTRTGDGSQTVWTAPDIEDAAYVGTFNSRYRPLDRRILIRIADTLSTLGVPFVFVSTQAIEAGVDISFARAYRDIGPLDSIVQTAGRCNRSFEWGTEGGMVTVWTLASPESDARDITEETPPAKYIYSEGGHLRFIAELLLDIGSESGSESVAATALERKAVPQYFEGIEERPFSRDELIEYIDDCEAETLGRESLINQDYQTVDILVAVTDADRKRIEDLAEAFSRFRGAGFEKLDDLVDLRVSVPVRDLEENLTDHVRVDHTGRGDTEGVDVFVHSGTEATGEYALNRGGFLSDVDDGLAGRFTLS